MVRHRDDVPFRGRRFEGHVTTMRLQNISPRFSRNSEANASEFRDNL